MSPHRPLLAALLLFFASTLPAAGQSADRPTSARTDSLPQSDGRVVGTVAEANGAPVAGAEVFVFGPEITVRANERGAFRTPVIAAGDYMVAVRQIGYSPAIFSLTVRAGEPTEVKVELARAPVQLETLEVTALGGRYTEMATRLRERRSTIIASDRLHRYASLEQALDFFLPVRFSSVGQRGCLFRAVNGNNPATVGAARESNSNVGPIIPVGTNSNDPRDLTPAIPNLQVSDIIAVEFIPPEFVPSAFPGVRPGCGVLQIWM